MRRMLVLLAVAVALVAPSAASAFDPNDPFAPRQWYLAQDHAFDTWSELPLSFPLVRVAVIDSGIDGKHPELVGRIAASRSFVGGSPLVDRDGHGTFVAGEIAAATDNGQGIAGLAFSARLLVAKVVAADGTISPLAEARAVRWAVDNHARVINLSLGGVRDPLDPSLDTYSSAEQAAIDYAVRHDVLVVAAVGNGDDAPDLPWPYASYPAALPHVIGVGAYGPGGTVPAFSNRDPVYNDIAAPGQEILSTFPRALTERFPTCSEQGYSSCGPAEFRRGEGTSFAAPQVTAAAALVFSMRPTATADQVGAVLERSAADATSDDGCHGCREGRDALTGWGRLDISAALKAVQRTLPAPDRLEPNDDAGRRARRLLGPTAQVRATLDSWDDRIDVYKVRLRRGQRLSATVSTHSGFDSSLSLWKPGTRHVEGRLASTSLRAARTSPAVAQQIVYRARAAGWYYLEVKLEDGISGRYFLATTKT